MTQAGFFLLGAAMFSPSAQAGEMRWTAALGGDARWFDWREYRNGKQLLVESGPTALARADLRLDYSAFFGSLALAWGGGEAKYDGQLQVGGTPYYSHAWEEISEAELHLGWQQDWGSLRLGLLQRGWHRNIDGNSALNVSSAEERYRWRVATVGGEFPLYAGAGWQLALAVDAGKPVMSFQKVYAHSSDAFEVEPGSGVFWRLALPFRFSVAGGRSCLLTPYLQYQDQDASNLVPASRNGVPELDNNGRQVYLFQPASERREAGISLSMLFGG